MDDPFGIEKKQKQGPTAGRVVTGALFPGWHGAIAGKPGHYRKVKAASAELVGGSVAPILGGGVGAYAAHEAGWLKKQPKKKKINKSINPVRAARNLQRSSKMQPGGSWSSHGPGGSTAGHRTSREGNRFLNPKSYQREEHYTPRGRHTVTETTTGGGLTRQGKLVAGSGVVGGALGAGGAGYATGKKKIKKNDSLSAFGVEHA